jgi:hypothetical protein
MKALLPALAILACLVGTLHAQVPGLVHYQGKVAVGTTNFSGTGQFKFALVDGTGAATYWSNDGVSTAGSQPAAAVSLPVANGLYSVILGDSSLTSMQPVPAGVFNNADVRLRIWFNDGTHGFQQLAPDQRVAAVGYAMMAAGVPNGSITAAQIASGAVTADKLAGGIALPAGGMVGSSSSADPALLAAGYQPFGGPNITGESWTKLSSVSPLPSNSFPQGVWTGTALLFYGGNAPTGQQSANQGARWTRSTGAWTTLSAANAPGARIYHTATWTGTEMIVWGGEYNSLYKGDGARYNPATNTWTPMSGTNAPSPRSRHTAVWTGTRLLIWGGGNSQGVFSGSGDASSGDITDLGKSYDPATDTWTSLSSTNAPTERVLHAAVWTGSKMIVWGGYHFGAGYGSVNDGAIYDPGSDSWSPVSTTGNPTPRYGHAQVWTGTEMLVWGGYWDAGGHVDQGLGGAYNPASNTWRSMSVTSEPAGRNSASSAWTGSELVIWGGEANGPVVNTGGVYALATDSWLPTSTTAAPPATKSGPSLWSGSAMLVLASDGCVYGYTPSRTFYFYQKQ